MNRQAIRTCEMGELNDFCGSPFWDLNLTWYTNNPDFTPCFEKTVLTWIPCGFLWMFLAADIYKSVTSRARNVPWSPLSVAKYLMAALLIVEEAVKLGFSTGRQDEGYIVYPVEIYTPSIKIATYVAYVGLLHFSRQHGVRSSGVQFLFWLLHSLCESVTFRTVTMGSFYDNPEENVLYIAHVMSYPLVVGEFILNCWADIRPLHDQNAVLNGKEPCPEGASSFLSKMLFSWSGHLIWRGFRKSLDFTDLWNLNIKYTSRVIVPLVNKYWQPDFNNGTAEFLKTTTIISAEFKKANENRQPFSSVVPALSRAFGGEFFLCGALLIIPVLMNFISPQILNLLLEFVSSDEPAWKGIFYAAVMFASALLRSVIYTQYDHKKFMVSIRVKTALINLIYRKTLRISNSAKKDSTSGEIMNLMSTDVQRVTEMTTYFHVLWSGLLEIAVALYFLWAKLGPSALAGLAVMILLIPINSVVAAKARSLQIAQMKLMDQRVKMMNETLSGVKVIKLYAWEPSFREKISEIRNKELATIRRTFYLNAIADFLWNCAPFVVALSTFGTYVLVDSSNVLDPSKVFVSLSLLNIMNGPITFIPVVVTLVVQGTVSINRLNRFLNAEEINIDAVHHDENEKDTLVVENGTFSWDKATKVLRNIDFRVKDGELVAVVGAVGSGKSSLLSAILGELEIHDGRVNTKGSIAYVAQQAWIQNATVRANILFRRPFDPAKYDKVISACALKTDLDILPARDQTEIGEKGINLSGGQKQRVSIARATYNNADVYLFDDPLSAVDSHVGKHIFDRVLGPKGLLKRKTRVLVTHGISFLPQCDNIVVMKDGEISEFGTYQELLDKKGEFAELIMQYSNKSQIGDKYEVSAINACNEDRNDSDDRLSDDDDGALGSRVSSNFFLSPIAPEDSNYCSGFCDITDHLQGSGAFVCSEKIDHQKAKIIDVEKMETKGVKGSVYILYVRAAGLLTSVCALAFYVIFQGFSIGTNSWLSAWSNQPIVNGSISTSKRDMFLGVYGALGFLQSIAILVASLLTCLSVLKSAKYFHESMLTRILHAPMSFFDTTPVGRIVNRFSKDLNVADNALSVSIRGLLHSILQVGSSIFVITYTTPIFLVVVIPVGALYYFIQRVFIPTSRQLQRLDSVARSPIYSHFGETIAGAATIRAFSDQERFIMEAESRCDQNLVTYFPRLVVNRWLQVRLESLGNILVFFAALFAVLGRETLSPGIVGLSVSYALQITIMMNILVRYVAMLEMNMVAIERLQEYVEAPQEAPWEVLPRKPSLEWPELGGLEFKQLKARYREGLDLVLRDVTCRIEPGEKVGVVGRTGAGKSSLTLGIFRIIEPAGGSIEIDGRDISKLGLHDIRGRLTIIPQDPVLFSGTVRLNLDPFSQKSDAELWRALELAHLKAYFKTLDKGLEYDISEGGENLSVGQRQLVCLARALLRKTKILVLDEATAAIDLETDELIQQTVRREFEKCTVITIAHRINTIMDSTRVMVLDHGEAREFDSPANLLQKEDSLFFGLARDAGLV